MESLTIHFLNVGHGDCTIIEFPNHLTMVDINNSRALDDETRRELEDKIAKRHGLEGKLGLWRSLGLGTPPEVAAELCELEEKLTDPVDFFINKYGRDASVFRYIQTHPDMDHMSGLYRLHVEEKIPIINFWDTYHDTQKTADQQGKYDPRDWETYLSLRRSAESPTVLFLERGQENDFYTGDGVRIWAPKSNRVGNETPSDINDLSYVLRIQFGNCWILLGGDAPMHVWQSFHEEFKESDAFGGEYPKIHLLKAPHHGRKSAYDRQSVESMNPDVTIVSVGELAAKDDATAGYEKYSNAGCFSTRDHGDLTARCWQDGDVWLYNQDGEQIISSMQAMNAPPR
jgi:competence protein ComEC